MKLSPLAISEVIQIDIDPSKDERGFFARVFDAEELARAGLVGHFPQCSISFNTRKDTLRGLHWQAAPYGEVKLVRCTLGAVLDVAVDVRPGSPSYGHWVAVELSAVNRRSLYIPQGFAHGFQTLCDCAEVLYQISQPYRPECARGVRWDDPDLAISWPQARERILSDRDAGLPLLRDVG
jgi:dTDP-4-dehydrorhamnose 3,5-epimerase